MRSILCKLTSDFSGALTSGPLLPAGGEKTPETEQEEQAVCHGNAEAEVDQRPGAGQVAQPAAGQVGRHRARDAAGCQPHGDGEAPDPLVGGPGEALHTGAVVEGEADRLEPLDRKSVV